MDVREKERKFKRGSKEQGRALMNLHNNEAGRRVSTIISTLYSRDYFIKSAVNCKSNGVLFKLLLDYYMGFYDIKFNEDPPYLCDVQ